MGRGRDVRGLGHESIDDVGQLPNHVDGAITAHRHAVDQRERRQNAEPLQSKSQTRGQFGHATGRRVNPRKAPGTCLHHQESAIAVNCESFRTRQPGRHRARLRQRLAARRELPHHACGPVGNPQTAPRRSKADRDENVHRGVGEGGAAAAAGARHLGLTRGAAKLDDHQVALEERSIDGDVEVAVILEHVARGRVEHLHGGRWKERDGRQLAVAGGNRGRATEGWWRRECETVGRSQGPAGSVELTQAEHVGHEQRLSVGTCVDSRNGRHDHAPRQQRPHATSGQQLADQTVAEAGDEQAALRIDGDVVDPEVGAREQGATAVGRIDEVDLPHRPVDDDELARGVEFGGEGRCETRRHLLDGWRNGVHVNPHDAAAHDRGAVQLAVRTKVHPLEESEVVGDRAGSGDERRVEFEECVRPPAHRHEQPPGRAERQRIDTGRHHLSRDGAVWSPSRHGADEHLAPVHQAVGAKAQPERPVQQCPLHEDVVRRSGGRRGWRRHCRYRNDQGSSAAANTWLRWRWIDSQRLMLMTGSSVLPTLGSPHGGVLTDPARNPVDSVALW